jgi:hypothetical protein
MWNFLSATVLYTCIVGLYLGGGGVIFGMVWMLVMWWAYRQGLIFGGGLIVGGLRYSVLICCLMIACRMKLKVTTLWPFLLLPIFLPVVIRLAACWCFGLQLGLQSNMKKNWQVHQPIFLIVITLFCDSQTPSYILNVIYSVTGLGKQHSFAMVQ